MNTTADIIYERAKTLPETQAVEVLNFLEYLQAKLRKNSYQGQAVIWETNKGNKQTIKAWLASENYQHSPPGNPDQIEQTVQEVRDSWGD